MYRVLEATVAYATLICTFYYYYYYYCQYNRCHCCVEVVEEYMSQLDSDDVPKTSSSGARRRLVQLIVQLPPQDLAVRFCRQLGDDKQQLDAFDEFRRARDSGVIGVAHVATTIKHSAVRTSRTKCQFTSQRRATQHDVTRLLADFAVAFSRACLRLAMLCRRQAVEKL